MVENTNVRDVQSTKLDIKATDKDISSALAQYKKDVETVNKLAKKNEQAKAKADKKSSNKNLNAALTAQEALDNAIAAYTVDSDEIDNFMVAQSNNYDALIAALEAEGKKTGKVKIAQTKAMAKYEETKNKIDDMLELELPEIDVAADPIVEAEPVAAEPVVEEEPALEPETPAEEHPYKKV